jgi:hypothetical protein
MKSVIGLFCRQVDITSTVYRLKGAGFAEEKITLLTQEKAIRRQLGCEPTCVVSRYAGWGASIGMVVYGIFALFAGLCQCNLFEFDKAIGIGTFLGGIVAGAFVGAGLGSMVGAAEYEKNSHLYVQGARIGGSVIVIQTRDEEGDSVMHILEQEKVSGVKAL